MSFSKRKFTLLVISTFLFSILTFISLVLLSFQYAREAKAHLYIGYSELDHLQPVPPNKVPCEPDSVGNPEFHSLRPYQASPCADSDKTYFCWNDYKIQEEISRTWGLDCTKGSGSYYQCPVNDKIEKTYVVDGELARFPIMGNTERVTNSQGP